jgi:hypothetical protein
LYKSQKIYTNACGAAPIRQSRIHHQNGEVDNCCERKKEEGMVHYRNDGEVISWYSDESESILHRIDGPAVIRTDGTEEWWINGLQLARSELYKMRDALQARCTRHPKKYNWDALGPTLIWGDSNPKIDLCLSDELRAIVTNKTLEPWLRHRLDALSRKAKALENQKPQRQIYR